MWFVWSGLGGVWGVDAGFWGSVFLGVLRSRLSAVGYQLSAISKSNYGDSDSASQNDDFSEGQAG